ncbi:hypothetical protein PENSTE_c001G03471 [Penicillium steckii]|uniref:Uncharacterized protein n=1 Tax=Penicillium steckii TaxID=303698 RepID=A0A1V6U0T2_9EURO|nr:hypothetical protein PENSTE_c001G03471 [Penicillium steckii]
MAIFDSEKRPRGLRVPSLTAMKAGTAASVSQFSFHRSKSNESRTPEEESVPVIPSTVTGSSYPPPPAPPPTKDLPTPPSGPKKELPPRPKVSTKVPPRKTVGSNSTRRPSETSPSEAQGLRSAFSSISPAISTSPPKQESPLPPTPSRGLRQAGFGTTTTPVSPPLEQDPESPATIKAPQGLPRGLRQTETPVSPQLSKPDPVSVPVQQQQQSLPPTPPVAPQNTPPEIAAPAPIPARVPVPVPAPTQQLQNQQLPPTPPPVTLSPPPTEEESDAQTPLEDFIPTPEGATTPLDLEQMSSNEASGPTGPPALADIEPVTAPLNKVHFACFQEHRNMPVAQNVWCPVPCMTCHKHDQEIRHRCVFCSLRICEGCYRSLQKMKNRSLAELVDSLAQ